MDSSYTVTARKSFCKTKSQCTSTHPSCAIHVDLHIHSIINCHRKGLPRFCEKACLKKKLLSWVLNPDRVGIFCRLAGREFQTARVVTEPALTKRFQIAFWNFQKLLISHCWLALMQKLNFKTHKSPYWPPCLCSCSVAGRKREVIF